MAAASTCRLIAAVIYKASEHVTDEPAEIEPLDLDALKAKILKAQLADPSLVAARKELDLERDPSKYALKGTLLTLDGAIVLPEKGFDPLKLKILRARHDAPADKH